MSGRAAHHAPVRELTADRVVVPAAPTGDAGTRRDGVAAERPDRPRAGVRPEIQGLRAIAVLLVVIYHLWPDTLPGGYVGVDVFFAISGFLITAHLLREATGTGRLSLPGFWARRARRLLPASLTVLLFSAVMTILAVPEIHWQSFLNDIVASATYVQNWHLAANSVDYLASKEQASPVQHFWSLAAEEQFYLVWPVLILGALAVTRGAKRTVEQRRHAIFAVLALVTLGSLVASILYTRSNPQQAYFVTYTRAWEFGAGGLLALLATSPRGGALVRSAVSWAGLVLIAVVALVYTNATPFPGSAAALPVLGTLAVIWAGAPAGRLSTLPLLRLRPVQLVGDISYSVYLWHWSLLILSPFVLGHRVGDGTRAGVLVASLLAAWATKVAIEDPVRSATFFTRRPPRLTFAFSGAAMAVVLVVATMGTNHVEDKLRQSAKATAKLVAQHPRCFGAASHDPAKPCVNPKLRHTVVPLPLEAKNEPNPACTAKSRENAVSICEFGTPAARATRTFALIGDSHATHWRAGMEVVARRKHWHGLSITHTGCPFSLATYDLPQPARDNCVTWNHNVPGELAKHPEVDTVFVSDITGGNVFVPKGKTMDEAKVAGYMRQWAALPPTVKRIVVIRDTPKAGGSTLDCVNDAIADNRAAGPACSKPVKSALLPDPAAIAAQRLGPARAQVVDLTRFICTQRLCSPVIGGVLVYKDVHHLTRTYATTLGPYLDAQVTQFARAWR